jgi:hypothetical protein
VYEAAGNPLVATIVKVPLVPIVVVPVKTSTIPPSGAKFTDSEINPILPGATQDVPKPVSTTTVILSPIDGESSGLTVPEKVTG